MLKSFGFFFTLTHLIVASWGEKKKKKAGGDVLFSFTFCVQSCEGRFHFFSSAIKNTVQGFLLSFHTRNEVLTKPSLLEFYMLNPSLSALKLFPPSVSLQQSPSFLLPVGSVWRNSASIFINHTIQIDPELPSDFACTITSTHFIFTKIWHVSPDVFVAPPAPVCSSWGYCWS